MKIIAPNAAWASNGVVHVIDGVLLPFAPNPDAAQFSNPRAETRSPGRSVAVPAAH